MVGFGVQRPGSTEVTWRSARELGNDQGHAGMYWGSTEQERLVRVANLVTRPHAVFVALLLKAIQAGLDNRHVVKPSEGLQSWRRYKLMELSGATLPRLTARASK